MSDQLDIIVSGLSKSYSNKLAINALAFEVNKGEIFGLIGPDGAGKTTLIRILATLLVQDAGTAKILKYDTKKDFKEIRNLLGYMPGRFSLYQDLSVEENLTFFATIFNSSIEENYHLIRDIYIQLEPFKNRRAGKLSGGMKQKLALCCALIHKPKVLLLDEPTTGVDAVSRKEFWEILKGLQKMGITILVSTPYMDEASLCDRIALINNGKFLSIETPTNTINRFSKKLLKIKAEKIYQTLFYLRQYDKCYSAYPFGQYIHYVDKDEPDINEILKFCTDKSLPSIEITPAKPTIEDCFIQLMTEPSY